MQDYNFVRPQHRQQIVAFAVLLLLQFGTGPACCLAMAMLQPHGAAARDVAQQAVTPLYATHAHHQGASRTGDPQWHAAEHLCSACNALGRPADLPLNAIPPKRVAWLAAPPAVPFTPIAADPRDSRPSQPRAPPTAC